MKHQAVIFDLDGTLLNTLEDLAASTNAALAALDLPLRTVEEVRTMVGNGIGLLMRRAVPPDADDATAARALEAFKAHYAAHALDRTALYPQAQTVLETLARTGIPTAVVSNKADFAVQTLHNTFFRGLVTFSMGERPPLARKPAPDMVEAALRRLGCPKDRAIYVGDSQVDAQTARAAGMDCALVTWGFRTPADLLPFGYPLAATARDLLNLL